jgi:hypothetical protein
MEVSDLSALQKGFNLDVTVYYQGKGNLNFLAMHVMFNSWVLELKKPCNAAVLICA